MLQFWLSLQMNPYDGESWIKLLTKKSREYMHQFCDMSSLHGVRYLAEKNRSLLERCFGVWFKPVDFSYFALSVVCNLLVWYWM